MVSEASSVSTKAEMRSCFFMKSIPNDPESGECAVVEFPGFGQALGELPFFDRCGERWAGQPVMRSCVEARLREHPLRMANRFNLGGGILSREGAAIEQGVDF